MTRPRLQPLTTFLALRGVFVCAAKAAQRSASAPALKGTLAVACCLGLISEADALLVSLEEPAPPNALAQIETRTGTPYPYGFFRWEADGIPHLNRQWFWYRIGLPEERNLGDLSHPPSPPINDTNANSYDDELDVRYVDPDGLEIRTVFRLRGDGPGTRASTMTETITVRNTGPGATTVFFYAYADFDLEANGADDQLELTGASGESIHQEDPNFVMTQAITGTLPTQFEADLLDGTNDLVPRLDDALSTTLSNFAGPLAGNGTYAHRWDLALGPSGSPTDSATFQIVKRIEPRPTPPVPVGAPSFGWTLAIALSATGLWAARLQTRD